MRETILALHLHDSEPVAVMALTAEFRQEGSVWLAECFELGTAAYASTLEKSSKELLDAIELQLNEVEKLGFAREFLRVHGVRVYNLPGHSPQETHVGRSSWENLSLATV